MGSVRGDQGERTGAGAPPVAALGIIGQVVSRLPINMDKINNSQQEACWLIETAAGGNAYGSKWGGGGGKK